MSTLHDRRNVFSNLRAKPTPVARFAPFVSMAQMIAPRVLAFQTR